jgi:hypothetical protein
MRGGFSKRVSVGAVAAALSLLAAAPTGAGEPIEPRNGTYSGVGAMVDSPQHWVRVGVTLKGADVRITAGEYSFPGCTGGVTFNPTTLGPNRFETSSTGPNSETNTITGRWVSNTKIRGKVVLERPSAASCGDPGTYVYRYAARRYGRP